ncbi:MAG: FAD-binding oxidoreductase, partial [Burkholderiales bacterium]|nr:FAD-binding oxidoreductase [Burkholderiales bacterium]
FVTRAIPVIGLEPSCLHTLHDEAQVLGLGEAAVRVGAGTVAFETFAVREAKAGRFAPPLHAVGAPILVHGHCHQKAFGIAPDVLAALALIPGAAPAMIESSCCGMAGSFGLEAEHRAVSLQMAELALLPAVRAAPVDAIVVADGTSCRSRIGEGAGRDAVHAVRVFERALGERPAPAVH